MGKTAIILFNLGGPDGPRAVRPFLFNLFNDRRIIGAPAPVRVLIAGLISTLREKQAQANYALMGGRSPIVPETEAQAAALNAVLAARGVEARCFVAMRYWTPFAADAAAAARAWGAREAILLPLYPQFSTTTTASAQEAWAKAWGAPFKTVCCYPTEPSFAQAHADAILNAWRGGGAPPSPRVLFSAHGLPQRVVDAGDPYQWQVEQTAGAVRALLPPDWDFSICYQSRVGPLKWIGPATDLEIRRAGAEGRGVIVSPIAFVSEHVETLVELDHEYKQLAQDVGLPFYLRAPALSAANGFIESLADLVDKALADPRLCRSGRGERICPASLRACAMGAAP